MAPKRRAVRNQELVHAATTLGHRDACSVVGEVDRPDLVRDARREARLAALRIDDMHHADWIGDREERAVARETDRRGYVHEALKPWQLDARRRSVGRHIECADVGVESRGERAALSVPRKGARHAVRGPVARCAHDACREIDRREVQRRRQREESRAVAGRDDVADEPRDRRDPSRGELAWTRRAVIGDQIGARPKIDLEDRPHPVAREEAPSIGREREGPDRAVAKLRAAHFPSGCIDDEDAAAIAACGPTRPVGRDRGADEMAVRRRERLDCGVVEHPLDHAADHGIGGDVDPLERGCRLADVSVAGGGHGQHEFRCGRASARDSERVRRKHDRGHEREDGDGERRRGQAISEQEAREALGPRLGARDDGASVGEGAQVRRKRAHARVALLAVLRHRLHRDGREVDGNARVDAMGYRRIELVHEAAGVEGALEGDLIRPSAEQRLVEDQADRVDVDARVDVGLRADFRAADLLGRHVGGRADERAALRLLRVGFGRRGEPRDAEVDHAWAPVAVDEDVRGLQVAVHDAAVMAVLERVADGRELKREGARVGARIAPPRDDVARVRHALHHDEGNRPRAARLDSGGVEPRDRRVLEAGERRRLGAEARDIARAGALGPEDLHGDRARGLELPRREHRADAAAPKHRLEHASADRVADSGLLGRVWRGGRIAELGIGQDGEERPELRRTRRLACRDLGEHRLSAVRARAKQPIERVRKLLLLAARAHAVSPSASARLSHARPRFQCFDTVRGAMPRISEVCSRERPTMYRIHTTCAVCGASRSSASMAAARRGVHSARARSGSSRGSKDGSAPSPAARSPRASVPRVPPRLRRVVERRQSIRNCPMARAAEPKKCARFSHAGVSPPFSHLRKASCTIVVAPGVAEAAPPRSDARSERAIAWSSP